MAIKTARSRKQHNARVDVRAAAIRTCSPMTRARFIEIATAGGYRVPPAPADVEIGALLGCAGRGGDDPQPVCHRPGPCAGAGLTRREERKDVLFSHRRTSPSIMRHTGIKAACERCDSIVPLVADEGDTEVYLHPHSPTGALTAPLASKRVGECSSVYTVKIGTMRTGDRPCGYGCTTDDEVGPLSYRGT